MKKVIRKTGAVILAFLLLAGGGLGTVQAQKQQGNNEARAFRMGMYRIKNTLKMKMLIEKTQGQTVAIRLYDQRNRVLQRHVLGKKAGLHAIQFDFEDVADGEYRMVVSSGGEEEVKNIRLSTANVVEVHHPRTLMALN